MWTGPVLIKGGGIGEWARLPEKDEKDEKMKFSWFGGLRSAFFGVKNIVGRLTIVTAGARLGGGDGSGKWKLGR